MSTYDIRVLPLSDESVHQVAAEFGLNHVKFIEWLETVAWPVYRQERGSQ